MKRQLTNYLSITKKEWNGTTVLVVIILLVIIAPYIYQGLHKDKPINFTEFNKAVAALNNHKNSFTNNGVQKHSTTVTNYALNKLKPGETIELNTADSASLKRVHGIGPSFAKRIIRYRKKLGGFINKEQLKEVYGLDAEKYAEISNELRVDATKVKTIPINIADFETLRHLGYLSYKQANAVIQYREQHGSYRSINDMRSVAILNEDILHKISPYITFK